MKVCKIFEISYAHAIKDHPGKCRNLHGHNAKIEIIIEAPVNTHTGMVIDFDDVSDIVGTWIKRTFDHKTIIEKLDNRYKVVDLNADEPFMLLDHPPTAEVLSTFISQYIHMYLVKGKITVRFWETSSSYAESKGEDRSSLGIIRFVELDEVGITG